MLFNTLKEIKTELAKEDVKCKLTNHNKTLVVELKNNSFLIDKRDGNNFDLLIFENTDYEIVESYYNILGFNVLTIIRNFI